MNSFPFESCFIILLSRGKNESKQSIITKQEKEIASTMSFHIWKDSSSLSHQTLKVYARGYKKHFSSTFFPQDIRVRSSTQYWKVFCNIAKMYWSTLYTSHKNHVVSNVLDGRVLLVSCGRGSLRESRKFSFINWGKRRATFGANREKCFMPSYSSLHSSFIFV